MISTSAAVQATCRRPAYRPYRTAGRKAEYGRFSVLPRPEIYRNLRIKDSVKIDMACGSGGMLSSCHDFIMRMNPDAKVRLFGQENNPESHAICLADMLIKNQAAENIRFADTMKTDCFEDTDMRFVIANPPFGQP